MSSALLAQAKPVAHTVFHQTTQQIVTTNVTRLVEDSPNDFQEGQEHEHVSETEPAEEMAEQTTRKYNDKDWQNALSLKVDTTARCYKTHIKAFRKVMGNEAQYVLADIDYYFARMKRESESKPEKKQDSRATLNMRKAALTFYLNDCLGLNISFKKYSLKHGR